LLTHLPFPFAGLAQFPPDVPQINPQQEAENRQQEHYRDRRE